MAALTDIKKQIAKLEKQAELMVKAAASEAAKKARELIAQHNLSAKDVGLAPNTGKSVAGKKTIAKTAPATARPAGVPKYRDPKTGKTWTGNGKAPGWIATAKKRDKFLISAPEAIVVAAAAPAEPVAVPKKAATVVAATKKAEPTVIVKKAATPKSADAPPPAAPVKKAVARKTAAKKALTSSSVVEVPTAVEVGAAPAPEAAN